MGDWPGFTTNVSGQPVELTSGTISVGQSGLSVIVQSGVQIAGSISSSVSGQTVIVASGVNVIVQSGLGIIGTINTTTDISGQLVDLVSGAIHPKQSGLNVIVQSGLGVSINQADLSGIRVVIPSQSGLGVTIQSGAYVNTGVASSSSSGNIIQLQSGTTVFLESGANVNVGILSISISGQPVVTSNLFSLVSGGFVNIGTITISGQGVIIQSGQYVNIGIINISVSNQPVTLVSGALVGQSGLYVSIQSGIGVGVGTVTIASISGLNVSFSSGQQIAFYSGETSRWSGLRTFTDKASLSGLPITLQSGINVNIGTNTISTSVSGNIVLISGQGVLVASGLGILIDIPRASGLSVILPTTSISGNIVGISGQFVQISGQGVIIQSGAQVNIGAASVSTSISGNFISLASGTVSVGQSGLYVTTFISGVTAQMLSGQALYVQISGYTARLSGLNVVATFLTDGYLSGMGVTLDSGSIGVYVDRDTLSGLSVIGDFSATADVSGQPVSLVSGAISVGQSGLYVIVASGLGIMGSFSADTDVSGQSVGLISGAKVIVESGLGVVVDKDFLSGLSVIGDFSATTSVSAQPISLVSGALTVGQSGLRVISYVSGNTAQMISGKALYVQISGYNSQLSGIYVITSVNSGLGTFVDKASLSGLSITAQSGTFVNVGTLAAHAVTTSISGNAVFISGFVSVTGVPSVYVSGNVQISGQGITVQSGTSVAADVVPSGGILARAILKCTSASAGTQLVSGIIHSMTLKSLSGAVYVGGTGAIDMPYAGYGMLLAGGEAMSFDVGNFNMIRVCAATSGDSVSYVGIV